MRCEFQAYQNVSTRAVLPYTTLSEQTSDRVRENVQITAKRKYMRRITGDNTTTQFSLDTIEQKLGIQEVGLCLCHR